MFLVLLYLQHSRQLFKMLALRDGRCTEVRPEFSRYNHCFHFCEGDPLRMEPSRDRRGPQLRLRQCANRLSRAPACYASGRKRRLHQSQLPPSVVQIVAASQEDCIPGHLPISSEPVQSQRRRWRCRVPKQPRASSQTQIVAFGRQTGTSPDLPTTTKPDCQSKKAG